MLRLSPVIFRRRRLPLLAALACAFALAGCGSIGNHANGSDAGSDNNGVYLKAGNVVYQLQVSRQLNQFEVEDHQYLTGLPAGTQNPTSAQFWYGVFLWAQNKTNSPQKTSDSFDIVDTEGNKYYPVALSSSVNQYAWISQTLGPEETEPGADTTAAAGPTGGGLLLFKLGTAVYANRPLTLEIHQPGVSKPSTISLDL
jgi:hypothetical protein